MAKLNTLALKEINSIIIKKGKIKIGEPGGKNAPKNLTLWSINPDKIITIKEEIDKKNVTITELVIV